MSRQDRKRRMRVLRRKLGASLLPLLAPRVLSVLSRSWRVERVGMEHLEDALAHPSRLAAMWHGRMLLPIRTHRNLRAHVLVSPSDDGSLIGNLIQSFGYRVIRGSSNKNPARAIREMVATLGDGATIVITPDGPRGPLHSVNPGPAWIAKATGFPILPCGFVADRAWHLSSWDRFTIPKWGARVVMVYGEPIHVARDADADQLAAATERMRARLLEAEEEGFRVLGQERDW